MTVQSRQAVSQASEGRLGHDRLQQGSDELAQQAPGLRPGQAARGKLSAQRERVLESVDERLEQKDDQEMGQDVRSGGAFVSAWRSLEADQALQALEAELDPPSEAIKSENVGGREGLGGKRGHHDHPVRGGERSFGNLMALLSRLSARHPSRGLGGLPGLLDGDEPQSERLAALASNEDRPVDQSAVRRLAELGEKIDWLALGVEPTGVPQPARISTSASCSSTRAMRSGCR